MNKIVKTSKLKIEMTYILGVILFNLLASIMTALMMISHSALEFADIERTKDQLTAGFLGFLFLSFIFGLITGFFALIGVRLVFRFNFFKSSEFKLYFLMPVTAFLFGAIPLILMAFAGVPIILLYLVIAPIPTLLGNYLIVKYIRWKYQGVPLA